METIERNGEVQPEEIADVRESVGWDRLEEMRVPNPLAR